ncbi:hypothetical protein [Gloeobacter kilaueensis]|uniref:Uncharacterized protein n=1 Tax=Gloeobacter kilaueensis (strain ATCC BAA-2537 / CCAP 1431/1 / ULC 316 / JS1) TaxID=1183438 RepID=U5QHT7_GLOK1|nr:hypothetical protein [Gloeobacter kilaueensis]AGY58486.1 hypothetical protein GKIL_2240 [Gloeobacter kilaueensis JS1]
MDAALKIVLEKARSLELRALRTEVSVLKDVLVVRAVLQLAGQEFTAHAVAERPSALERAEDEAQLRVFALAGIEPSRNLVALSSPHDTAPDLKPATPAPQVTPVAVEPASRSGLFDNSGPLVPENDPTDAEISFEPDDEPFDREALMGEVLSLMSAIKMEPKEGRAYLIATYNKRSRTELSDEELQSFVEYLRAQHHTRQYSPLPF